MTLVKFNRPQRANAPVMRSVFDEFFNSFPTFGELNAPNRLPAVNISESEDAFNIELSAPGFAKDEFSVEIEENNLVITGEKKDEKEHKEKNYTRKEFSYVNFKRSFTLPENADAEKIEGRYENGVLHLNIPKLKDAQKLSKKIELK
ncbi:MAG: Hsp20/alpha crystallin family protein [Flavobacteriales bacterium]